MGLGNKQRIALLLTWSLVIAPISVMFESIGASLVWIIITAIILAVIEDHLPLKANNTVVFYVLLGILTFGLISFGIMLPENENEKVTIGEHTEVRPKEEKTNIQKDRVDNIRYSWLEMYVKEPCYPNIKKDLKEGLEKFGYLHKDTYHSVEKKCRAQEKLGLEAKLVKRDKQLLELVK